MNQTIDDATWYLVQLSKDMDPIESREFFTNILYFCLDRRSPNGYADGALIDLVSSALKLAQ